MQILEYALKSNFDPYGRENRILFRRKWKMKNKKKTWRRPDMKYVLFWRAIREHRFVAASNLASKYMGKDALRFMIIAGREAIKANDRAQLRVIADDVSFCARETIDTFVNFVSELPKTPGIEA